MIAVRVDTEPSVTDEADAAAKRKFTRRLTAATAVGTITVGLISWALNSTVQYDSPRFDHIITGHYTEPNGKTIRFAAGVATSCLRDTHEVVVDTRASLVADTAGAAQSARGKTVDATFTYASGTCAEAIGRVYSSDLVASSEAGDALDNISSLSTQPAGEGYHSTGQAFQQEISQAEKQGIPVIHVSYSGNIGG